MTTSSTETATGQLYREAAGLIPGGTSRVHYFYQPHPIYARSAKGCRLTDVDGVERLDFLNNMTSLIHGHGHPAIQQVNPLDAQADQLAPAQPAVGGHQDQRPVAGVDYAGQPCDLGRGQKAHLLALDLRQPHGPAG